LEQGVIKSNSCFYCEKEKEDIVLLGKLKCDDKISMYGIYEYEPCDKCKKNMDKGITFLAVDNNLNPTGKYCVVKEETIDKMIHDYTLKEEIKKVRKCKISPEEFDDLFYFDLSEECTR